MNFGPLLNELLNCVALCIWAVMQWLWAAGRLVLKLTLLAICHPVSTWRAWRKYRLIKRLSKAL